MSVIELGLVTDGDGQAPTPGRPQLRRDLRRALLAAVAVICLLGVTGSARPDQGGLPRLWSVPFHPDADQFAVTADSVYTVDSRHDNGITAYDLRTGAVRWFSWEFGDAAGLGPFAGDVMLLPAGATRVQLDTEYGTQISQEVIRQTVAVDTATGRQLWRQPGEATVLPADRVVLADWSGANSTLRSLRVVRARDGGTVWSRPAAGIVNWTTGSHPERAPSDRLVTVTANGTAEVTDLADGRVLATGRVPWGQGPAEVSLKVDEHRLYVGAGSTVSAYDTETLRLLWRIPLPDPGGFFRCGPMLCLNGTDSTSGYDRDTGEPRWRIDSAQNGFPLPDDLLMVNSDETGARHRLADSRTGRILADISAAVPAWNFAAGGGPYLLARTRQPADLTSISRYDPETGEVLLRGAMPPVVPWSCRREGSLLACVTLDGRLAVTDAG